MKPLADVRIVSIEQYGAGPFATSQLAELGAEVVKIEDPSAGGDIGRYVPPYQGGEDSLFFETFNLGKRSIGLDVRSEAGRRVLEDLVAKSDAVFSNLRGDVPEKLRIRYEDLRHCNPAIVCCSLTGFGMAGSRTGEPGYDYILQGAAGWMDLTGEPDGAPTKTGLSLVDYSGGYVAAISLMAALHAARRDGIGADCDISLYDTALSLLSYPGTWHLTSGFVPARTRHSAHPSLVPFQNFQTADGWIVVGCAKEKFWERLVAVLELPDVESDPRFGTFGGRQDAREDLLSRLEGRFKERTTAEWLLPLRAAGVPCGPVNTVAEALAEPLAAERQMIVETEHPRFGLVRQVAPAVRVGPPGGDRDGAHRRAPQRDEHAGYVLRDLLGYDDDTVRALRAGGAFGPGAASGAGGGQGPTS
ncbi:MAG: CaiB/BaiF CoA transferase family protein [Acidimicrobiales bacterium]